MLRGILKGELKMSKAVNRYLDLCLKCGACSKFCPSGIDVVDIISFAKAEYFKLHKFEQFKAVILKFVINTLNNVKKIKFTPKSKIFDKKVVYFAGCGGLNKDVIKIFNSMNIEVIVPDFKCCGFPFFIRGDMDSFKEYMDSFCSILEKYKDYDVVTNCATCEKTLKSYEKWNKNFKYNIKNVLDYIKENNLQLELKKPKKVTYHKPCNLDNYEKVKWILENTKNLEYVEMKDFDLCCGLGGLTNIKEHKIISKLFRKKQECIKETGVRNILTSCLACKITLSLFSFGKYKVQDFAEFLAKNSR